MGRQTENVLKGSVPEKDNYVEEVFFFCFKMNTLLFCVFTFRVDCEMYSLSIWKFSL